MIQTTQAFKRVIACKNMFNSEITLMLLKYILEITIVALFSVCAELSNRASNYSNLWGMSLQNMQSLTSTENVQNIVHKKDVPVWMHMYSTLWKKNS